MYKISFGQILFFLFTLHPAYILHRDPRIIIGWFLSPYTNFISGTRVPNFFWFRQVVFDFYCSGHPAYITYVSLYWAKEVARCTGTRNMTAFFIERKKVVARCTATRCTHCDPLHSLWPVALTVTRGTHCYPLHLLCPVALTVIRCSISFCKSIISLSLSVSRIRLGPWKY